MTRQGWTDWADKKVHTEQCRGNETVYDCEARLLRNEHRRAVRVVKKEIKWQAARIAEEQQAHNADGEAVHNYALLVVHDILAALQKGRT